MMWSYIRFLLFIIAIYPLDSLSQSQLPKVWENVYGGMKNDGVALNGTYANFASLNYNAVTFYELSLDDSGNVYFAVSSNSGVGGNKASPHCGVLSKTDCWVVKLNPIGQKVWEQNLGSENNEYPLKLVVDTIHRFIYMVGSSKSTQSSCQLSDTSKGQTDVWIAKLDWNGNLLWSHLYGGPNKELPVAATMFINGNLLILSASESVNGGGDISSSITSAFVDNSWMMCVNPGGQIVWDRWLGSDICETKMLDMVSLGNYAVAVGTVSGSVPNRDVTSGVHYNSQLPGNPGLDGWVVKLDTNGNRIWDRTLGGYNSNETFTSVAYGVENVYILGFTDAQVISGDITDTLKGALHNLWFVTLDSLGLIINSKSKGCPTDAVGIDIGFFSDKLFSLGYAVDPGMDNWDTTGGYWLMAMDTGYHSIWSTCVNAVYGLNGMTPNIVPTPDSGLIYITTVNDTSNGEFTLPVFDTVNHTSDIWVLKLNPFSTTTSIADNDIKERTVNCFPNPATTSVTVSGQKSSGQIELYDLSGRRLFSYKPSVCENRQTIPLDGITPGIYLVKTNEGMCKVVKE